MLSRFLRLCGNIRVTTEPMTPLGRWSTTNNNKERFIKAILANHDCCGDRLCGNPLHVKKQVEDVLLDKKQGG